MDRARDAGRAGFEDEFAAVVQRWANARGLSVHSSALGLRLALCQEVSAERRRLERAYRSGIDPAPAHGWRDGDEPSLWAFLNRAG